MDDGFTGKTSAFNEAVFQIQRLHTSWLRVKEYSNKGLYDKWYWEIQNIWDIELFTDAVKLDKEGKAYKEGTGFVDEFTKLNKKVVLGQKWARKTNNYILYRGGLREISSFLRYLQDAAGKGSKYEDLEEDFMD